MDSLKQITQRGREEKLNREADPEEGLEKIDEEEGEEEIATSPLSKRQQSAMCLIDKIGKKASSNGLSQ